jgi:hypothetical protein
MGEVTAFYPLDMTPRWKMLIVTQLFSYWGSRSTLWHRVAVYLLPNVSKDYESDWLITLKRKAVRSLERPGRNHPKTTAQQHTRPGSSTVMQWKPQIAVFILLKMCVISHYFNFNRLLCRVYARKVGTIKVFIFGRQSSWTHRIICQNIYSDTGTFCNIKRLYSES